MLNEFFNNIKVKKCNGFFNVSGETEKLSIDADISFEEYNKSNNNLSIFKLIYDNETNKPIELSNFEKTQFLTILEIEIQEILENEIEDDDDTNDFINFNWFSGAY